MSGDSARQRIEELAHLHAFISLTEEDGPGSPVAVKDLVDVRGTVTTGGGIILPPTPAAADAPVVTELRRHGCYVVGKANLHEWAFGVTSANPHYGAVLNPHDTERVAGGSSGGSAVAVATGTADWAVGSDTGGSIRVPASLCGVVGFKPTYGTVEMAGVIPLSQSLDTLGPLAPDVRTAATGLEMMTGRQDLASERRGGAGGFRIGAPADWLTALDDETAAAWAVVSDGLPEVRFLDRKRLGAIGLTILFAEAAAYHRQWVETQPESYGADVLAHLRDGLKIGAADYIAALREMALVRDEVEAAMQDWDALLVPATSCVAPRLDDLDVRDRLTRFTRPFNATGQPVITIPAPARGLPVGIQVVGHLDQEQALVEVALALESEWRSRAAEMETPRRA